MKIKNSRSSWAIKLRRLHPQKKKRGEEKEEEREARVKEGREILCVTTKTLIKQ